MSYTPELIQPDDPNRIVTHDEGAARLAQIREYVEQTTGLAEVRAQVGNHEARLRGYDHPKPAHPCACAPRCDLRARRAGCERTRAAGGDWGGPLSQGRFALRHA